MKAGEREGLICCSTTIKILCHHCESLKTLKRGGRCDVVNCSHDSSQRNVKRMVFMGGPQGDFRKVLLHNS